MSETVGNIEKKLARMLGATGTDPVSELAEGEADELRDIVQEIYTQCFIPIDGHRPKWAEQMLSLSFRKPVTATVGLTEGSQVVSSAPGSAIAGERMVSGKDIWTYAGNGKLLGEWNRPTGDYTVTFYQVCKPIPLDVSGIEAPVECIEHGPLHPLMDEEHELMLRSFYQNDFYPVSQTYRVLANSRRYKSDVEGYDIGDPWYYYLDSAAISPDRYPTPVEPSGAIQTEDGDVNIESDDGTIYSGPVPAHFISQRMYLYPFPDHPVTVRYRGTINPQVVDSNTAIHLPADVFTAVFMPLAREAVAENFPDYPGDNVQSLRKRAENARRQLRTLARPQRRRSGPLNPAIGW